MAEKSRWGFDGWRCRVRRPKPWRLRRPGLGKPVCYGSACARHGSDDCAFLEVDGEVAVMLGLIEEGLKGTNVPVESKYFRSEPGEGSVIMNCFK